MTPALIKIETMKNMMMARTLILGWVFSALGGKLGVRQHDNPGHDLQRKPEFNLSVCQNPQSTESDENEPKYQDPRPLRNNRCA